MLVSFECTYCGEKWTADVWGKPQIEVTKCRKCGDSGLKVKDAAADKIDYYKGSPKFPVDPDWE